MRGLIDSQVWDWAASERRFMMMVPLAMAVSIEKRVFPGTWTPGQYSSLPHTGPSSAPMLQRAQSYLRRAALFCDTGEIYGPGSLRAGNEWRRGERTQPSSWACLQDSPPSRTPTITLRPLSRALRPCPCPWEP